jgi:hypothetical protein
MRYHLLGLEAFHERPLPNARSGKQFGFVDFRLGMWIVAGPEMRHDNKML